MPNIHLKTCPDCNVDKPTIDYPIIRDNRGSKPYIYFGAFCKKCQSQRVMASQRKKWAEYTAKVVEWQQANPERVRAAKRRYYEANRDA